MKITEKFLNDRNACQEGMEWVAQNKLIGLEPILFLKGLMNGDKNEWANWLIVRVMTQDQKIRYAIYAAEQVIDIYKKNYPNDNRPRKAIKEGGVTCLI